MATFKESSYLGSPNDYYDLEDVVEESSSSSSSSSSFDSEVYSPCSSPSSSHSSHSSPPSVSMWSCPFLEPLFVMEKNEANNTINFKTFDFIMHTNYVYPAPETSRQNYTRIYRTFGENDFSADKTTYEKSNAEMIICNLEIDGTGAEYEIELSHPYNFNVVGNLILDEKFIYWYILKTYNYAIESSLNYKITCITKGTKDVTTFQLDRSCGGLRVLSNEYEKVCQ
jgi:hypothetical protein